MDKDIKQTIDSIDIPRRLESIIKSGNILVNGCPYLTSITPEQIEYAQNRLAELKKKLYG